MKYTLRQNLIKELETRKQQCIEELENLNFLITYYKNKDTNIQRLKYRRAREKLGMNQKALAKKAGVGMSTVYHFENGIQIRQENYDKILNVLNENSELN